MSNKLHPTNHCLTLKQWRKWQSDFCQQNKGIKCNIPKHFVIKFGKFQILLMDCKSWWSEASIRQNQSSLTDMEKVKVLQRSILHAGFFFWSWCLSSCFSLEKHKPPIIVVSKWAFDSAVQKSQDIGLLADKGPRYVRLNILFNAWLM